MTLVHHTLNTTVHFYTSTHPSSSSPYPSKLSYKHAGEKKTLMFLVVIQNERGYGKKKATDCCKREKKGGICSLECVLLLASLGTASSFCGLSSLGGRLLLAHDVGITVLALREGRLVLVALVAAGRKLLRTQAVLFALVATGHPLCCTFTRTLTHEKKTVKQTQKRKKKKRRNKKKSEKKKRKIWNCAVRR